MTESEWVATTDLRQMMAHLGVSRRYSERKGSLLSAAYCRRVWDLLTDRRSREAVESLESYVDGLVSMEERLRSCTAAADASLEASLQERSEEVVAAANAASTACTRWCNRPAPATDPHLTAIEAARASGMDWHDDVSWADLVRCVFGGWQEVHRIDPVWLTTTVVSLAQAAYDERQLPNGHLDNGRLAVLADALEEAGCSDADLLSHLRGPGPHVRGCHGIDALLGKS